MPSVAALVQFAQLPTGQSRTWRLWLMWDAACFAAEAATVACIDQRLAMAIDDQKKRQPFDDTELRELRELTNVAAHQPLRRILLDATPTRHLAEALEAVLAEATTKTKGHAA